MIDIVNIGPEEARIFELKFKKYPESIIKVYHPNCGHCKAMESDWNNLEKELKNNYKGDVGVFNVHAEALSNTNIPALKKVKGYPTIMAIKNGKSIEYQGDRSKDHMLKFFKQNLNLKKINEHKTNPFKISKTFLLKNKKLTGGRKLRKSKKKSRRKTRKRRRSYRR